MKAYYTRCLIEGHPFLVAFAYGSDNNVVSERLVEKLQYEQPFIRIKHGSNSVQSSVWRSIMWCCSHGLLSSSFRWAWLRFKTLNLDECSICL